MAGCSRTLVDLARGLPLFVLGATAPLALGQADTGAPKPGATKAEESKGLLEVPEYKGDWLTRGYLTGTWNGARTDLANHGLTFDVEWTQSVQIVTSGGIDTATKYGGSLDELIHADLMRMGLLPGALLTFRAESRYGDSVNGKSGVILPVNLDSAMPITDPLDGSLPIAVTEFTYTQLLSEQFGLIAGKLQTLDGDANEFAGGRGRYQFMNSNFVQNGVIALAVPYSTLGAGLVLMPTDQTTITSIVMNTTDSSTTSGFNDISDGTTWVTEASAQYRVSDMPGGMNVGFIDAFHGDFSTIQGKLELNPGSGSGPTLQKQSASWAAYWSGWQYLYSEGAKTKKIDTGDGRPDLEGVGAFARFGFADADTNPIDWSGSIGLGGRGLDLPKNDTWGIGYFYTHMQEPRSVVLNFVGSRSDGMEAFYNISITRAAALTLDVQWISSAFKGVDNAFILGARLNLRF